MRNISSQVALLIGMLVIFSLMSCGGPSGSSASSADAAPETAEAESPKKGNTVSFSEEDIAALKDKFIFDEGSGFYYHKQWNRTTPKRRTLTADVNQSGYFILNSNYYGQGLNHSKVTIRINGEKMSTENINRRDKNEHQQSKDSNGQRWEVNTYTKYRDKGIFEAIGKSEGPVEITFIGPDATTKYEEITTADIEAIKDCYQLSLLMRLEAQKAVQ